MMFLPQQTKRSIKRVADLAVLHSSYDAGPHLNKPDTRPASVTSQNSTDTVCVCVCVGVCVRVWSVCECV